MQTPSQGRRATVQSDEELIERANKGDAAALDTLYRRHRDRVYRLARRFGARLVVTEAAKIGPGSCPPPTLTP